MNEKPEGATDESRFDLQQLLKDLESEGVHRSPEKVGQSDILNLLKSRKKRDNDG